MRDQWDVVVVGAGPAGASAAREAARAGAAVCLLEASREIGHPIRTSGGSFLTELRALGVAPGFTHPVHRVTFVGPRRRASFEYTDPVLCVLDVRGLYQRLAAEAAAAGAVVRVGGRVTDGLRGDGRVGGVVVRAGGEHEEVRGRVVIDASGFPAVVLTRAGLRGPWRRYGYGAEYDLLAPACDEDEALLLVGDAAAPSGYAWLFPRGGRRVRVGAGVLRPDTDARPEDCLARVLAAPAVAPRLAGAQPLEAHSGYIPSEPPPARLAWDGLLVAGDAAGQASTLVGEGIRYAMRAGRLAGEVAAAAVRAGDTSARGLRRYQTTWLAEQGRAMRIAWEINRRIARWDDARWDEGVALLARLGPTLVAEALAGDLTPAWALRALAAIPTLIGPFLRRLLSV